MASPPPTSLLPSKEKHSFVVFKFPDGWGRKEIEPHPNGSHSSLPCNSKVADPFRKANLDNPRLFKFASDPEEHEEDDPEEELEEGFEFGNSSSTQQLADPSAIPPRRPRSLLGSADKNSARVIVSPPALEQLRLMLQTMRVRWMLEAKLPGKLPGSRYGPLMGVGMVLSNVVVAALVERSYLLWRLPEGDDGLVKFSVKLLKELLVFGKQRVWDLAYPDELVEVAALMESWREDVREEVVFVVPAANQAQKKKAVAATPKPRNPTSSFVTSTTEPTSATLNPISSCSSFPDTSSAPIPPATPIVPAAVVPSAVVPSVVVPPKPTPNTRTSTLNPQAPTFRLPGLPAS
ncbi:hypothetical protein BDY24DRAFT_417881 [Mrakia frigida]|uniref:uncharacterized protein n=1 Tax=Mrakia frigida TaxID=29902 RepID=UPI003FCC1441